MEANAEWEEGGGGESPGKVSAAAPDGGRYDDDGGYYDADGGYTQEAKNTPFCPF